jgi:hypothetical protein
MVLSPATPPAHDFLTAPSKTQENCSASLAFDARARIGDDLRYLAELLPWSWSTVTAAASELRTRRQRCSSTRAPSPFGDERRIACPKAGFTTLSARPCARGNRSCAATTDVLASFARSSLATLGARRKRSLTSSEAKADPGYLRQVNGAACSSTRSAMFDYGKDPGMPAMHTRNLKDASKLSISMSIHRALTTQPVDFDP